MLSVNEMRARLQLLQGLDQQDGGAIELCRIAMREMPLTSAGEDASEYIPFALHPDIATLPGMAVRRLRELMVQYMIEGVTISAHKLPQQSSEARAMMQSLRANFPALSLHLSHHWCADAQGAEAFRSLLHQNWHKAWEGAASSGDVSAAALEKRVHWLGAVNILLLKLIRQEIQRLPDEHGDELDLVMVQVLGAAFQCLVAEFLAREGFSDSVRQRVQQMLVVPATPLAFFRRQPRGQVFSDAQHIVTAYGLESELLPRMRQIINDSPAASAKEVLDELASESLADHLLKRSWMRLALRDMAERSGQSLWLKWARDVKRLDMLLSAPVKAMEELGPGLQKMQGQPLADWLLAHADKDMFADDVCDLAPWREDEISVRVFLLFEQDAKLEIERRSAEQCWLDREEQLVGNGRGAEAGRILREAHARAKVVLLQADARSPLYSDSGASALQACLRVEWSKYLQVAAQRSGAGLGDFLQRVFQAGIEHMMQEREGVFVDSLSGSGLLLRGETPALLIAGIALREALAKWLGELDVAGELSGAQEPVVSMCLAVQGGWTIARHGDASPVGRLAYAPALAQAEAAVSCNDGLERLLLGMDARDGLSPLGGVRIEAIPVADGKSIPVLCNRGFALTRAVLQELVKVGKQLRMHRFRVPAEQREGQLSGYRLPGGKLEGISLHLGEDAGVDAELVMLVHVGKVLLAGSVEDVFEVMDPASPTYAYMSRELPGWSASGSS